MSSIISYGSKCFNYLQPLLKNGFLDPQDAYVLGSSFSIQDPKDFEETMGIIERLLILKKVYEVNELTLQSIYCLLIEQNLGPVILSFNALGKSNNFIYHKYEIGRIKEVDSKSNKDS